MSKHLMTGLPFEKEVVDDGETLDLELLDVRDLRIARCVDHFPHVADLL
jgi:hypothetical protein